MCITITSVLTDTQTNTTKNIISFAKEIITDKSLDSREFCVCSILQYQEHGMIDFHTSCLVYPERVDHRRDHHVLACMK